jgi:hypothetical protein
MSSRLDLSDFRVYGCEPTAAYDPPLSVATAPRSAWPASALIRDLLGKFGFTPENMHAAAKRQTALTKENRA